MYIPPFDQLIHNVLLEGSGSPSMKQMLLKLWQIEVTLNTYTKVGYMCHSS